MQPYLGVRLAVAAVSIFIVAATACFSLAAEPGTVCAVTKQAAAAKSLKLITQCYLKAANNETPVDDDCLAAAADKLSLSYGKADVKGGCLVEENATEVLQVLNDGVSQMLAAFPVDGGTCASTQRKVAVRFFNSITRCSIIALKYDAAEVDHDCLLSAAAKAEKALTALDQRQSCIPAPLNGDAIEVLAEAQTRILVETPAAQCETECSAHIEDMVTRHQADYTSVYAQCRAEFGSVVLASDAALPYYRFELRYSGDFCGGGPRPMCYPNLETISLGYISSPACIAQSHTNFTEAFPKYGQWAGCVREAMAAYETMTGLDDACAPPPL